MLGGLLPSGVMLQLAVVAPGLGATRPAVRPFDLFADVTATLGANRVACEVDNRGSVCGAGSQDRGEWPAGTGDGYIFSSGLQLAGRIADTARGPWAGDTVGAYFADPRGTQEQGVGLTPIFDSRDARDALRWPRAGLIRDTAVFAARYQGRPVAADQDLWMRFWDGDARNRSGRPHPMGVVVDLRLMAWNAPTENADIVYMIYDVYNVTAADPTTYAGLDPAVRGELAALGARFRDGIREEFGVEIPAAGYRIDDGYAAVYMDADVADASHNLATFVLPFDVSVAYHHAFMAPSWDYPPAVFGPPFARRPGMVGISFLRTPEDRGRAMYSQFTGSSAGFPDPTGVSQLWRTLSGRFDRAEGDLPCTLRDPLVRGMCWLNQSDSDTRFFQSTGPFTLAPGGVATLVVAYIFAAPVANALPSAPVQVTPGIPATGVEIASGTDTVRNIERIAGWVSHADIDGDGAIASDEVTTVPRSFLHKAQYARRFADAGFFPPSPPDAPESTLRPGDFTVTIEWEPSVTEEMGDPYADLADSGATFDPDFRRYDVEGYRIYRGRDPGAMQLIAQFDYTGTTFVDRTGLFNDPTCAPELGVRNGCAAPFAFPISANGPSVSRPLTAYPVQVPPGGRETLTNGSVIVHAADTLLHGSDRTFPPLMDTGVPFTFVDRGVLNGLTYLYAVTAFDVNSVRSGPSSLESTRTLPFTTPRVSAATDLSAVHTVPDPYYVTNAMETSPDFGRLRFVNLPERAVIRIYSASGILVDVLEHNDSGGGGEEPWTLRNRNGRPVGSGVYFFHVETPDGRQRVGRFTILNYAR